MTPAHHCATLLLDVVDLRRSKTSTLLRLVYPLTVYSLYLAIVLLVVIVVSSVFSFSQELLTARTLAGFQNLIPNSCIVIRDSIPARIPAANLVVGDVVQLETGGRVPAGTSAQLRWNDARPFAAACGSPVCRGHIELHITICTATFPSLTVHSLLTLKICVSSHRPT